MKLDSVIEFIAADTMAIKEFMSSKLDKLTKTVIGTL